MQIAGYKSGITIVLGINKSVFDSKSRGRLVKATPAIGCVHITEEPIFAKDLCGTPILDLISSPA
jgi:hypothetical protein